MNKSKCVILALHLIFLSFSYEEATEFSKVRLWADFHSRDGPQLSDQNITWLANTYDIVSLEKCFYTTTQERAFEDIIATAKRLKAANPKQKVLAYWHAAISFTDCYESWAHPNVSQELDWYVKDTSGSIIWKLESVRRGYYNDSNPEVREWWVSVAKQVYRDADGAIDGFFFDGSFDHNWKSSQVPEKDILNDDHAVKLRTAYSELKALDPNILIIGNGIGGYPHHQAKNYGYDTLEYLDGACVEHFGSLEGTNQKTGIINPDLLKVYLTKISEAQKIGKKILIRAWPGPITRPIDQYGPSWPANFNDTVDRLDQNNAAAKAAEYITFPLCAFLCGVEENAYFTYSWWYSVYQGSLAGYRSPADFYPELAADIGEPVAPAEWEGYKCSRLFENAFVQVDLSNQWSASITYLNNIHVPDHIGDDL